MLRVGFELAIPVFEQAKIFRAFDRAVTPFFLSFLFFLLSFFLSLPRFFSEMVVCTEYFTCHSFAAKK
jgi:hypothetical protein